MPPGTALVGANRVAGVGELAQLTAGARGTCGLGRDGAVWCWGVSALTPPVTTTDAMLAAVRPAEVPALRGARALAFGDEALFAIDVHGRLVRAELGPAGVSAVGLEGAPTDMVGLAAGGSWACGLASGAVWCAGWGPVPRVTDAAASATLTKRAARAWKVAELSDAVGVSVWTTQACAVTTSGAIGCWGDNGLGGLGDGTLEARFTSASRVREVRRLRVAAPATGVGGCLSTDDGRAACAALGVECLAVSPPGYWSLPPSGVDFTYDPAYRERVTQTLSQRAVPACMCTCDEAWLEATRAVQERDRLDGPVPTAPR